MSPMGTCSNRIESETSETISSSGRAAQKGDKLVLGYAIAANPVDRTATRRPLPRDLAALGLPYNRYNGRISLRCSSG
jgi:hypothetical protein